MREPIAMEILGEWIKIKKEDLDGLHGYFHEDKKMIGISDKLDVDQDEKFKTILHEIIHGILQRSGIKYQLGSEIEESIVRAIEHGLSPLVYFRPDSRKIKWKNLD